LRNELAMTLTASSNSFQIPAHHTDLAPDCQLFLLSPPDKDMPPKDVPLKDMPLKDMLHQDMPHQDMPH
jgi:hypothetical protein